MASYEEIHGKRVETFSSDPTLDSSYEGQVWFNSTSGTLKSVVASAAWVSASALSTSRQELNGAGTADSALAMGGYTTTTIANTEEFNGSGWSNAEDMPAVKHAAASGGLQTAAFIAGGYPDPAGNTNTYEYDGTNWGSGGALSQARRGFTGSGTLTAGLAMGGFSDPVSSGAPLTNVEEYDGSSWTNGGALPAGNANIGAAGTQAATVAFGGYLGPPGNTTNAYHYDGSSWTATGSMNTARSSLGGSGIQTSAMGFGGGSPASNATELYNGSTWTTSSNMGTARFSFGSAQNAPSNTTGLAFGGGPPHTAVTEDWNISATTITAAAFSSGNSLGTGRYGGQPFGSGQTSQVAAGGLVGSPSSTANVETYDGTSWSEGNNLNTSRGNGASGGTETAGVVATGRTNSTTMYGQTEEYDGTSFSEVNDCPSAAYRQVGAGTQTALMICGGIHPPTFPPYANTSFEYDGTNWTSGGAMPQRGNYMDGVGVQTAAVLFGAINSPSPNTNNACLDYDGSSFSANNNMNINHGGQHFVGGTVTDAIVGAGGAPYAVSGTSETYDGTTFTTNATIGQPGQRGGKSATVAATIACGGANPPVASNLTSTEEYTAASTAVNAKTLTTS
jgi:hypothetical protein